MSFFFGCVIGLVVGVLLTLTVLILIPDKKPEKTETDQTDQADWWRNGGPPPF